MRRNLDPIRRPLLAGAATQPGGAAASTRWAVAGAALATAIAVLDAVAGETVVLIGLLATAPLVAGIRGGVGETTAVGAYALLLALVLGASDGIFGTADHLARTLVVALVAVLATWMAALREHTRRAANDSRTVVTSIFNSALDSIISMDGEGRIVDLNTAAERTFGFGRDEARGRPLADLIVPERHRQAHWDGLARMRAGEPGRILGRRVELTAMRADGGEFPVELTVSLASREPLLFTGFARDITPRQAAERERERNERRASFMSDASALLESSLDYEATLERIARLAVPMLADWAFVEIVQDDGSIKRVAMAHSDPAKEALVRDYDRRYPINPDAPEGSAKVIRTGRPDLISEIPDTMLEAVAEDPEHLRILRELGFRSAMVVPLRARDRTIGDLALVSAESGRHYDEDDLATVEEIAGRCALAIDNARLYEKALESEARLRHQALTDPLTGLPNRTLFLDRLGLALARAGRRPGSPALLFFDLDGFKNVNDELGHQAGDELLKAVAGRLEGLLRAEDTVSRYGGDEFAILCEDLADEVLAAAIAERIVRTLEPPFELEAGAVRLGASLGVVFARGPEETSESMLRDADAAMYQAKRAGGSGFAVFGQEQGDEAPLPRSETVEGPRAS